MIRAVIFDMDGLMYNTEPQMEACWLQAARHSRLTLTPQHLAALRSRSSPDREKYLQDIFGDRLDYRRLERLANKELSASIAANGLPLKPGLWELLVYLRRNGYRLAVQTDNTADTARWYLELSGCAEFFDAVVTGRMVAHSKPEPDIYERAAAQLGLPPQDCLVLEDTSAGIVGAHRALCPAIMIPDLDAPSRGAQSLAAAVLENLSQVIDYLRVQPQRLPEKPMPHFRNIIFDLGGVVVEFDPRRYLSRRFADKKVEDYLYKTIFASPQWREMDAGRMSLAEASVIFLKQGKKDGRRFEVQTVLDEWMEKMLHTKQDTVDLLQRLKENGCRLYYLSNIGTDTFGVLSQRPFMQLFDGGIASCRVGLCKPQEGIYRRLLETYGLAPEETVFFDDTRENVECASALGITGLHFHSATLAEKNLEGYRVLR